MRLSRKLLNGRVLLVGLIIIVVIVAGCEYFSDVVIPTTDTTDPIAVARLSRYVGDELVSDFSFDTAYPIYYETNDINENLYAIAAGYDSGGMHELMTYGDSRYHCRKSGSTTEHTGGTPMLRTTVHAEPGDTVSNGLWRMHTVDLNRYQDYCEDHRPGSVLTHVNFTWHIYAYDFHFNYTESRYAGTIVYNR